MVVRYQDRMVEEMQVRGLAEKTQKLYAAHMGYFIKFSEVPPGRITLESIRRYQLHMVERKLSWSYFNQAVQAIRFFFRFALPRDWRIEMIPFQKQRTLLPEVLATEEVTALINAVQNIKHQAILETVYSGGLRVNEVRRLRVTDIDSKRMTIRIQQGKGGKDRYVMLSPKLLETLRQYCREAKRTRPGKMPKTWLFPGVGNGDDPINERTIQKIVKKSAKKAGIRKRVTTHTLRHSFATHLLESGTNIRVIQQLLGHRSLNSTIIYTHVAKNGPIETRSPLDDLKS